MAPITRGEKLGEAKDPEFVEIPGDTTLWKTQNIASEKIYLPIEAYGRWSWYFPIFGVAAALSLYYSVELYRFAAENWVVGSLLEQATWLAEVLACLFIGILAAGMFARMVWDSTRPWPLLVITGEALWDRRQLYAPVPWRDVESIKFQSFRDTLLVYLKLAQPVPVRRGLFRLGGALRGGPKSTVQVLISDLGQNDDKIAEVIVALVRKHGGKIEGYSAYAPHQR